MREVGFVEQAELFEVVRWVQIIFVQRLLADNRVEEVTALGHVAGRRHAHVAFGISMPAAVGRGRDVEIGRHLHRRAVEQRERFPAADLVAENIFARPDADDIPAQRRARKSAIEVMRDVWNIHGVPIFPKTISAG